MNIEELEKENNRRYQLLKYLERSPNRNNTLKHVDALTLTGMLLTQISDITLVLRDLHEENIELKKMLSQVLEKKDENLINDVIDREPNE